MYADETAPARYFDPEFKREAIKIHPGQYYAAQRDVVIVTVVGSCVSACLWDPVLRIGGMNHFMLPGEVPAAGSAVTVSARLGVFAMEILINQVTKLGADRSRLVAKVFGGGSVIPGMGGMNIGNQNGTFVLEFLEEEQIPVLAQDLFEECARKVYFFPDSGRVLMKKLLSLDNDTVKRRERDYLKRLGDIARSGRVDLFAVRP